MYDAEFWKRFKIQRYKANPNFSYIENDNFHCRIPQNNTKQVGIVSYIDAENIEEDLAQISDIFQDKPYYFQIRNTDRPEDLKKMIKKTGYKEFLQLDLKILPLNENNITKLQSKIQNDYSITDVSEVELRSDEMFNLKRELFPSTTQSKSRYLNSLAERYQTARIHDDTIIQYVYRENGKPIAMGSLVNMGEFENTNIGLLDGAGTLPQHRNHGIYTSILTHRCMEAFDLGIDLLYTEARINSSSKILEKFQFKTIDSYVYLKPE